jgi:hypothetical protein
MSVVAQTDENTQPFYLWDTPYQQPEQADVNTGIALDSIFPPHEIQAPVIRLSLFRHTTLPVTHDDLQQRTTTAAAPWLFAALVILIALMFVYYNRNKLHIADLLKAAADHRAMDRLVRGNNLNTARLVPMGLFVTATLATSLYLMALTHNGITAWIILTAALFAAYILRNLVARLLGNVFDDGDTVATCITSNYIYHLLLATVIAPLLLLQTYLPWGRDTVFYIIASFTAVCLVLRLFRSLKLFLTFSKSRSFYLFFYLCTVEAVPILALLKWFLVQ